MTKYSLFGKTSITVPLTDPDHELCTEFSKIFEVVLGGLLSLTALSSLIQITLLITLTAWFTGKKTKPESVDFAKYFLPSIVTIFE
jgi:hypothetical protein